MMKILLVHCILVLVIQITACYGCNVSNGEEEQKSIIYLNISTVCGLNLKYIYIYIYLKHYCKIVCFF